MTAESQPEEAELLHVRAFSAGITYIGGDFCPGPDGESLRRIFESGRADLSCDIRDARRAVHAGLDPDEAMIRHHLDGRAKGRKDVIPEVTNCLGQIAAGLCRVYPRPPDELA